MGKIFDLNHVLSLLLLSFLTFFALVLSEGENANKEQAIIEEEAREIREAELNEKWQKFMLENEI